MDGPDTDPRPPKRRRRQVSAGHSRFTVVLSDRLSTRVRKTADRFSVSVGEVLRESVEAGLKLTIQRLRHEDDRETHRHAELDAELRKSGDAPER